MTTFATADSSAIEIPDLPDTRADVPRVRCPAARLDEGQGRRRARPARQRQRGVRHRRQLAAAGRRAFARRAPGGDRARRRRASAPVHAVARGFGVRVARCPPTTCTARSTSNSTRASSISRKVLADLVPAGATVAVDELTGAMRRAAGPAVPVGSAVGCRAGRRPGEAGEDARPDLVRPQGVPDHRRGHGRTCRRRSLPGCVRSTCRRRSSGAPSNSAPPPTCSRRSGR